MGVDDDDRVIGNTKCLEINKYFTYGNPALAPVYLTTDIDHRQNPWRFSKKSQLLLLVTELVVFINQFRYLTLERKKFLLRSCVSISYHLTELPSLSLLTSKNK